MEFTFGKQNNFFYSSFSKMTANKDPECFLSAMKLIKLIFAISISAIQCEQGFSSTNYIPRLVQQ